MRRPRPPASLTSRLLQVPWPVCVLMMVLGQETSAKYICDHHAYVNDDLRRDTTNPDVPWRGDGFPIVWESNVNGEYTMHPDCSVTFNCPHGNLYSSFYYNTSAYFGRDLLQGEDYSIGVQVQMLEGGANDGGESVGLIAWQRGEGQEHYHKVSFVFTNAIEQKGNAEYHFTAYAFLRNDMHNSSEVHRQYACTLGHWDSPVDLQVFVRNNSIFTVVARLRGPPILGPDTASTIVETVDFGDFTGGQPPSFMGVEANLISKAVFRGLDAQLWDPKTQSLPVDTSNPCPSEKPTIRAFFSLLGSVLVLIVFQIVWGYRNAKENYAVLGNEPSVMELVGSATSGLQFFSIVGQAFYLDLCLRLGGQVGEYEKFFWATVGLLGVSLAYNAAVLLYTLHRYRHHLNTALLLKHRLAYALLLLTSLTNLELMTLYPWDYSLFPMASLLDGYPTPRVMRLCAVPNIIQSFPALLIQVLTNNIDNGYDPADAVLYALTAVTALDILVHFFSKVLQTYSQDPTDQLPSGKSVCTDFGAESKVPDEELAAYSGMVPPPQPRVLADSRPHKDS